MQLFCSIWNARHSQYNWNDSGGLVGLKGGNMEPRPLGLKAIDGLLMPLCKAYRLLTDHLITG